MKVKFNQTPVVKHSFDDLVEPKDIKNTFGLFNASVEDSYTYGSEGICRVLDQMSGLWKHDRRYITVDAKVHMLFPKMAPAIPGWHTDGIPRKYDDDKWSVHRGRPDWEKQASGDWRPHRYWLYNTSLRGAPTRFLQEPVELEVKNLDTGVYGQVNEQVEKSDLPYEETEPDKIYQFDWLNLHSAIPAEKREWRLLVRVVESDYFEPESDPHNFIRYQQQVYIQKGFGW